MAQQRRMIYDGVYANTTLNMFPIEVRYLYIGTLVLADDDGKLSADPRYLRGRLFSYDENITSEQVKKWLGNLAEVDQILLYEINGQQILKHPKWKKYQRIRADLHVPSKLPNPLRERNETVTGELLKEDKEYKVIQVKEGGGMTPQDKSTQFFEMCKLENGIEFTEFLNGFHERTKIPKDILRLEIRKFYNWWTERNKSGTKQKWELEKTFEVDRRLLTWFRNAQKWSKNVVDKYNVGNV